jgi:hypothetical protein
MSGRSAQLAAAGFGAALLFSLGVGCGPRRPVVPAAPAGPLPSAATLNAVVHDLQAARTGLRALARVSYVDPDSHGSARQVVLAERPDRLRLEVLSPLGTVFALTADDGALAVYVRGEAAVYRGRATRANLEQFAHVDLNVPDAVALLLGTPPQRAGRNEVVSFDPTEGAIELWREIDRGAQVIWFDAALLPVATEERDDGGHVLWRARFGDFDAQRAQMPRHIEIELPKEGRRVALDLQEVEVNPVLETSLFNLATPSGVKEIPLGDGVGAGS